MIKSENYVLPEMPVFMHDWRNMRMAKDTVKEYPEMRKLYSDALKIKNKKWAHTFIELIRKD